MKKISYGKHSTRDNVQLAATKLKTDKGSLMPAVPK